MGVKSLFSGSFIYLIVFNRKGENYGKLNY